MGNLFSHKYRFEPVHKLYTNRCRTCKYLFLTSQYNQLTCPGCNKQSNQSQSIESENDSLFDGDKVSDQ